MAGLRQHLERARELGDDEGKFADLREAARDHEAGAQRMAGHEHAAEAPAPIAIVTPMAQSVAMALWPSAPGIAIDFTFIKS